MTMHVAHVPTREAQLSLFPDREQMGEGTIQTAFLQFHAQHPEVFAGLYELACIEIQRGRTRISVNRLFELLRERLSVRLNNNFRSRYARLLIATYPELQPFIAIREVRTE